MLILDMMQSSSGTDCPFQEVIGFLEFVGIVNLDIQQVIFVLQPFQIADTAFLLPSFMTGFGIKS